MRMPRQASLARAHRDAVLTSRQRHFVWRSPRMIIRSRSLNSVLTQHKPMKRLLPIIAASLLVSNLSHAAATLPSYDGFNYTIGDPFGQTPPATANGFQWTRSE